MARGIGVSVFERHPVVTLAILVPISLGLTDFGFTAACHGFARRRPTGEPALRVRSETYHHTFAPNVSLTAEHWGPRRCAYRTNSLGFRDRVVRDVPLQAGGRRILFMGDSFTEGVGVPYEQTFVGLVDAALAPRGVEVLNAACSLYSPTIYERKTRALLDDVGLRFDQMVVFIDISDVEDELAYRLDGDDRVVMLGLVRREQSRAAESWGSGPRALHTLRSFLDHHTLLLARGFDLLESPLESPYHRGEAWTFDPRLFEEYGREGLARARAHMDALHALLRRHGIRLTIAVYPWPDQILEGDRDSLQERFWRPWAEDKGAAFLDYFPLFIDREPPRDVIRRNFIPGDVHWNEAGHRLVSRMLLDHLQRDGKGP